eukprot:TRINITY_DN5920_c0_g1_i2.p1 TRINITY_DN5920_c0_g1~~TRINITY_DN5920_c0_g1_i2.p1  ORF type:complete len:210 (+),score=51.79 TRINITY_DN5920_c0_g1_i2:1309-1938(+)
MIGNDTVRFWVSPYKRTKMTLEEILKSFDQKVSVREEPRIREQDWGNFQNPEIIQQLQKHRKKFGIFYFRFPEGESGADVYDRVSSFLESLFRDFHFDHVDHVVLVSHGITCRMFLMRFLRWSVDKFQRTWNLDNCEIIILEKQVNGSYVLLTPLREDTSQPEKSAASHVKSTSPVLRPETRPQGLSKLNNDSTPFNLSESQTQSQVQI